MTPNPGPRRFAGASALVAAANALFRRDRDGGGRRFTSKNDSVPRPGFDASISLHDGHLREAGLGDDRAAEAISAIRTAVRSMRGAGWVSVEYVGPWSDGWAWMGRAEWVTVYRSWNAVPPRGPEWDRLRASVEETVRMALEEVAGR